MQPDGFGRKDVMSCVILGDWEQKRKTDRPSQRGERRRWDGIYPGGVSRNPNLTGNLSRLKDPKPPDIDYQTLI